MILSSARRSSHLPFLDNSDGGRCSVLHPRCKLETFCLRHRHRDSKVFGCRVTETVPELQFPFKNATKTCGPLYISAWPCADTIWWAMAVYSHSLHLNRKYFIIIVWTLNHLQLCTKMNASLIFLTKMLLVKLLPNVVR